MSLYRMCHVDVPLYPTSEAKTQNTSVGGMSTGQLLVQTLLTTIKVLINLTHNAGKEGRWLTVVLLFIRYTVLSMVCTYPVTIVLLGNINSFQ